MPCPNDRMCLAATHFHDRPALAGRTLDLVDELAGKLGVAELVQILHDNTSELPLVFGAAEAATPGLGEDAGFSCRPALRPARTRHRILL